MKTLIVPLLALLLTACASQAPTRPANASDYDKDFIYPESTTNYVAVEKTVYPDPRYGVMVRYADKRMYGDIISVYVYPVPSITWEDRDETLVKHLQQVLNEIDEAIEEGMYQSRTDVVVSEFTFTEAGREFVGKKARTQLRLTNERALDSDVFLFLAEDKLIKFRTSFDANFTPDWTGDAIVREILPGIQVPPESEYMRELRAEYLQQVTDEIIRQLLKGQKEGK